jgi:hypothetical protein
LFAAVLLSGSAGLLYQVAWTRRVASVTSATVTAQAVVLGIFMAGLGAGALLAGRRARGLARPLLAYAGVEIAAALLASLSIPLIAWSDALRPYAVRLGADPVVGLWVQLLTLSAFLLLPAALMGASIPFVIEAVEREGVGAERSARITSALYAINTLGAAAGFRDLAGWWQAAAVAGFIGLGIEVVWTRLISLVVLNTVYAFTQVLQAEPFVLDPEALRRRVEVRGLGAELARNSFEDTEDLLSLFVMGPEGLRAWQEGAPLLTDDRPFLEFAAARELGRHAYQPILRSVAGKLDSPSRYLPAAESGEAREWAARSERIRRAILEERALPREQLERRAASLEAGLSSAPSSELVRRRYRNLVLE